MIGSILFFITMLVWSIVSSIICLPFLLLPRKQAAIANTIWAYMALFFLRIFCGISYKIQGRENIPEGAALFASQHQSAWETIAFFLLFKNPRFILKKSLIFIPFIGWYIWKSAGIPIDRSRGAVTLRDITRKSKHALEQNHQVVIFPEGTRTKPDEATNLKSGVISIAKAAQQDIIPITLDSGNFWPRNSWKKKSGVINVTIHPKISYKSDKEVALDQLSKLYYSNI